MIEEAAGTRMYEVKKEASIKTMEKKQRKLDEINEILETEIKPKLENLKQQRQQYLQWTSDQTELERLEKFCIAAEYSSFKVGRKSCSILHRLYPLSVSSLLHSAWIIYWK